MNKNTALQFNSKVAVVTGASTGIGKEIAIQLAQNGATLALVGRDLKKLKDTQAKITSFGAMAKIYETNLLDTKAIAKTAKEICIEFGEVSILINTAGVWHNAKRAYTNTRLADLTTEEIQEVFGVGINGTVLLTKEILTQMGKNKVKGGKIINISGTFENGAAGWVHYYVSKKAIEEFTKGLAQELRVQEIQVNCISPSDTKTPAYKKFFPKYYADGVEPSAIADLAIFFASSRADHITGAVVEVKNKKI